MTWGGLGLDGRLLYVAGAVNPPYLLANVQILDLVTGDVTTLFQAPPAAWISGAAVSPDGKTVVLAYQPPYGEELTAAAGPVRDARGRSRFALAALETRIRDAQLLSTNVVAGWLVIVLHRRGSCLQQCVSDTTDDLSGWSPGDRHEGGYWPSLSSDGTRLVYASVDKASGKNQLFVSNADGSAKNEVVLEGGPAAGLIDAPIFPARGSRHSVQRPACATSVSAHMDGPTDGGHSGPCPRHDPIRMVGC